MAEDLLAPFRRFGAIAPIDPAGRETEPYRAFFATGAGAKPLRLELRPKDGLAIARLYSALTEIAYDRTDYTGILLMFAAGRMVKIRGRGLRPVAEALLAGTCEYLAEIEDDQVPADGLPVIERMELLNAQPKAPAPPA